MLAIELWVIASGVWLISWVSLKVVSAPNFWQIDIVNILTNLVWGIKFYKFIHHFSNDRRIKVPKKKAIFLLHEKTSMHLFRKEMTYL